MRVRPTTDSRIARESDSSVESSASPPMRNVCRSLRAIPTPVDLRTSGRAFPDDHSHAGFPQGFLTRRILTFVSLCLADECHQPNCQRARLAPLTSTDGIGRCKVAFEQPNPAVLRTFFCSYFHPLPASWAWEELREAKAILTQETRRSTPYSENSPAPPLSGEDLLPDIGLKP
jgi:hypothetical protein